MKASELRIGNFVGRHGDNIPDLQLEKEHFVNILNHEWYLTTLYPIPLTKEWLLKFGFKKDDDFGNWHLSEYEIYILKNEKGFTSLVCGVKENKIYWYNYASDDYYSSTKKIEYVHRLQNLFFELKDEELTL